MAFLPLIKEGWSVNASRKTAMLICALAVTPIVLAARTSNAWIAVLLVALAAGAHQGWSANIYTLASDMFPRGAVASVVGFATLLGTVSGMLLSKTVGYILQSTGSYVPIFMVAGSAYLVALDFVQALAPKLKRARNLSDQAATPLRRCRTVRKPISNLRWWIGGLLFASTVINYIDRQTLSLLAPYLKLQYHWTNSDYANLAIAFRVAYSIGQSVFGRLMDRVGTRRGLTITVICYSIVSMLTSFARGFYSFATFRFLAGRGRISELACCDQGRLGVVPQTRASLGHRPVR